MVLPPGPLEPAAQRRLHKVFEPFFDAPLDRLTRRR
jgi:hypothetical protein